MSEKKVAEDNTKAVFPTATFGEVVTPEQVVVRETVSDDTRITALERKVDRILEYIDAHVDKQITFREFEKRKSALLKEKK